MSFQLSERAEEERRAEHKLVSRHFRSGQPCATKAETGKLVVVEATPEANTGIDTLSLELQLGLLVGWKEENERKEKLLPRRTGRKRQRQRLLKATSRELIRTRWAQF